MKKKNSLSVLIFANAFVSTKSIGGGDRFIIEALPYIARKVSTTVITPYIGLYHFKQHPSLNTIFQSYKGNPFDDSDNYLAITIAYLIRTFQTMLLLKPNKYTHLITSSQYFPDILPAAIYKLLKPNNRWVVRLYHLIPSPSERVGNSFVNSIVFLMQILMIRILKLSDSIITDNQTSKKYLIKLGFDSRKVFVLPSGIHWKRIKNHKPRTKQRFDAAYIGRLDLHRGIFDLPEIWREVVDKIPNAKLAIAGYGPKTTTIRLKESFKVNKLTTNVRFLGFLPHNLEGKHPLYDLLKSIKLLLLPIHEGGFPLTIAESLTAGVPVICYRLPIFKSEFNDSVITVKMKDTHTFAGSVIKLLSDKKSLTHYSRKAATQTSSYDYSPVSKAFIELVLQS